MGAKLFFYYSAMNAGKSATLLQSSHNYYERGMRTKLFIPRLIGKAQIASRIGLSAPALQFGPEYDFFTTIKAELEAGGVEDTASPLSCILVDEAQFLAKDQVRQLSRIADELNIPVLCYGLRSDFQGEPFEGSKYLLVWADMLVEVKTICDCGRKATMNQRVTADGKPLAEGEQVEVGGNEKYIGKCRGHFWEGINAAEAAMQRSSPAKKAKVEEVAQEVEGSPEKTPQS